LRCRWTWKRVLGLVYYVLAVLVLVHHYVICGVWFELEDVLHHEVIALVAVTIATLLVFDP